MTHPGPKVLGSSLLHKGPQANSSLPSMIWLLLSCPMPPTLLHMTPQQSSTPDFPQDATRMYVECNLIP